MQSADPQKAREVAAKLRAGRVSINDGGGDRNTPFGGYKMSGNGREWGEFGFAEYLETKAILGFQPPRRRSSRCSAAKASTSTPPR